VTRFPFLDWMRGAAVLIMIQCHVFNSFTRPDMRHSGAYILSQFVGGMAAPLFLFMAGMTSGFQMDRMERRSLTRSQRYFGALRRGGYILFIAYLFRFTNWLGGLPKPNTHDLWKVDILNCMGLAIAVFSLGALLNSTERVRCVVAGALLVAAAAPIVSGLDWSGVPAVVKYYLVPGADRAQFPFFPCAAYLGFGIAAGTLVKRAANWEDRERSQEQSQMDNLIRWLVLGGGALIFSARYFANLPFSVYPSSDFWTNSPALIFIRVGVMLLMLAGAYLWTRRRTGPGWSWMQNLGKTSLPVYWVHVTLVYGGLTTSLKRALTPAGSVLAAIVVTLLMTILSEVWLQRKARRIVRWKAATTVAGQAQAA
jgi:uncharacterized membrane protein